jgi:DNA-binding protein H-NS
MAKTYAQIQKQIDTLAREAEKLKRKEVEGVIGRIREAIATYGLTAADLGFEARDVPLKKTGMKPKGKRPAVAKFRDGDGNTWVGRGARPHWLRDALASGKTLEDFAI